MLGWRIAVSAVLIPLLIGIFYLDQRSGGAALLLLLLAEVLAIRSVWEMTDLYRDRTKRLQVPMVMACAAGVVLGSWWPHLLHPEELAGETDLTAVAIAYALSVMVLCASEAQRFQTPGASTETLGTEILIVSYSGLLLAVTAQLRWVAGIEAGYIVLGSLLVCAKGGDVGAYFWGRMFGRRKLAPMLSPGKTWAGALGAIGGAGLCGWLWFRFMPGLFNPEWQSCAWYYAILYGAIIGVVGLVGDLCESLLKRDAGKKDSAALLPGFGGLLDLLDSVVYAGPIAYLLWHWLPLATWK